MDGSASSNHSDKKLAKNARMRKYYLERRMTKSFACEQCEYVTSRKTHIRGHIKYAHEADKNLLACEHCDLRTTFHRMRRHKLAVHEKIKDFQCQELGCSFKSATKYGIDVHVKAKHDIKDTIEENIKGDINEPVHYLFDDKLLPLPLLATSIATKNINIYGCKLCDYMTETRDHLQAHENSVHGHLKVTVIEYDDTPYDMEKDFPIIEESKNISNVPMDSIGNDGNEKKTKRARHVMLVCMWCDYMTERRDLLLTHELSVHSEVKVDFFKYNGSIGDLEKDDKNYVSVNKESQNMEDAPLDRISNDEKEEEDKRPRHINIFNCGQCDYTTSRKEHVRGHIKYAHEGIVNMIACDHCDYMTEQKCNLMKHLTKRHGEVNLKMEKMKNLSCDQCDYRTSRKANLKGHLKFVHEGNINMIPCNHCDYMSVRKDALKSHLTKMHGWVNSKKDEIKNHSCKQCDYMTSGKANLRGHIKYAHENNKNMHVCMWCDYMTERKDHLKTHEKSVHGEVKVDFIEYDDAADDLEKENKIAPLKVENMMETNQGSGGDKLLENLRVKEKKVTESMKKYCTPVKRIPCGQCNYVTSRKAHLRGHIKYAHKGITNLHACEQCDYKTERKDHLKNHFKSMHQMADLKKENVEAEGTPDMEKEEKCDVTLLIEDGQNVGDVPLSIISNVGKEEYKRGRHVKIFKCEQCDYTTSRKYHVRGHVKSAHEGNKNMIACVHCDFMTEQKFKLMNHLTRRHGKVISKEVKIFSCDRCDYMTSRKTHLHGHIKYAHEGNVNMIACDHCDYMTEKNYNLMNHLARRHREVNLKNENTEEAQDVEADVKVQKSEGEEIQQNPEMMKGLDAQCFKCQAWFPDDDTFLIHVGDCDGKLIIEPNKPTLTSGKPGPLSRKAKTISNEVQECRKDSKTSNEDIGYGKVAAKVEVDQNEGEICKPISGKPGPLSRKAKRQHSTDHKEDLGKSSRKGSSSSSAESDSAEQISLNKFLHHMKGPRVRLSRLAKCQMCDFVAESVEEMTPHMLSNHVEYV